MRPSDEPLYAPRCTVDVGDERLRERIARLVVETTLSGADQFSVTLSDPFDRSAEAFSGLEWDDFEIGTPVSIEAGYGSSDRHSQLCRGRITAIEGAFTPDAGPTVTLGGAGRLRSMMRGTNAGTWSGCTLDGVVSEICSEYDFETVAVEADLERKTLIQDDQSDYRFLRRLAETYGFDFYAHGGTVRFEPREKRRHRDPVAALRYGDALDEFEGEIRAAQSDHRVEVRTWDPRNAEEIVATAGPSAAANTEVYNVTTTSRADARRIATERHEQLVDGRVECTGVADGTPALRAGVTIRLDGLGDRFSGRYTVTEATHRMGEGGYRTSFEATEVPA